MFSVMKDDSIEALTQYMEEGNAFPRREYLSWLLCPCCGEARVGRDLRQSLTESPSLGVIIYTSCWLKCGPRMWYGNDNPLQCSCLENTRDRGAWWAAIYGVAQSQTWLKRLSSSSRMWSSQWDGNGNILSQPKARTFGVSVRFAMFSFAGSCSYTSTCWDGTCQSGYLSHCDTLRHIADQSGHRQRIFLKH